MHVEEAIRTRQSVKVFLSDEVPREMIQQCIEMATWAPNHHLTEPWYFAVIAGLAREKFIKIVMDEFNQERKEFDPFTPLPKILKERKKILGAPVIIAVYSAIGTSNTAMWENYAATAASIQNLLLAAHSLGLGAIWRTSSIYNKPGIRQALRVPDRAIPVGAVFMGYSAQRNTKRRRTAVEEKTYWL